MRNIFKNVTVKDATIYGIILCNQFNFPLFVEINTKNSIPIVKIYMLAPHHDLPNKWISPNAFKTDLRSPAHGMGSKTKCFSSLRGWVNLARLRSTRVVSTGRVFSTEVTVVGVVRTLLR